MLSFFVYLVICAYLCVKKKVRQCLSILKTIYNFAQTNN